MRRTYLLLAVSIACASDSNVGPGTGVLPGMSSGSGGGNDGGQTPDGGSTADAGAGVDSGAVATEAGNAHFVPYLTSDSGYLPFINAPNATEQAWMRAHFYRMFAFTPYFDSRLSWSPPAWFYRDSYAIYPTADAESMSVANAGQFILKDGQGRRLYIPFGCSGGTCPQFAGDVGNPAFRTLWIDQAKIQFARGYKGIHVDDVNLEWRVSDGNGNAVVPIDPRTGTAMTLANYRRYFAEFMEAIRAAFPTAEIVHNSLWWVSDADPFVARQLRAADAFNVERGVVDDGLTDGTGTFAYETLLNYIERQHAHNTYAFFSAYGTTRETCEFNLATYYMVSSGRDSQGCLFRNKPNDFWNGYDAALGAPVGPRTKLTSGVFSREFTSGRVLTAPPNLAPTTVDLGAEYTTLDSQKVRSVSIRARQGLVLTR
jgi:hypothetical protein